jgi:hypothetical protein
MHAPHEARSVDGGPVVLRWPDQRARRDALAALGRPRLLVVATGHTPPDGHDPLEDWVRDPADPVEHVIRLEGLRARHRARARGLTMDEHGVLRFRDRWVALTERQQAVIGPLMADAGRSVPLAVLQRAYCAAGGPDDRAPLQRIVTNLRKRVAELGLGVHSLSGRAVLLEVPGEAPESR